MLLLLMLHGTTARSDALDVVIRAEMQRQHVPGVAVAVVRHGKVVKAAGYGLANVEHGVPVRDRSMFQSGSLGKQFTAAAVMLQVQDGKLALDDDIGAFFADAPATWHGITVRHLLTHTSGIPDYTDGTLDLRRDYSEDELARFAYGLDPMFAPGERWSYSNTGYVLLGIIVRKVSGSFYGDVLRERVFAPLGMSTARVISEADIVPDRVAGYRLVNGELKNQEWVAPMLNTTADGALLPERARPGCLGCGNSLRSDSRARKLGADFHAGALNSGNGYPYGFGWSVDHETGQMREHHSGSWQGFTAYISRYLEEDLSVVVLCNLEGARAGDFVERIAAVYDPALGPKILVPVADPDPALGARLAGLLDSIAEGTPQPQDFAFVAADFFSVTVADYRELLRGAGPRSRIELLERRQIGDDWVHLYRAVYGGGTFLVSLGVAPDAGLSSYPSILRSSVPDRKPDLEHRPREEQQ